MEYQLSEKSELSYLDVIVRFDGIDDVEINTLPHGRVSACTVDEAWAMRRPLPISSGSRRRTRRDTETRG
jgi:hypothetical protein